MLSLLRRTHVFCINRTISFTCLAPPHRSYCHPDWFSTAPEISSAPARTSESGIPSQLEIPGSGIHPARFLLTPLAFRWLFPRYVATRLPRKGRYPRTRERLSLLPRIFRSIPHFGVSRGHRNVPMHSANHFTSTPDSSGLRGLLNRIPH